MTDDEREATKSKMFELVNKHVKELLRGSEPTAKVEVEDFDPKDPSTIRMKITVPVPWINVTLSLDDPEEDNRRLRAEIAAAKMLEPGEWRPYHAAAILLEIVVKSFGCTSVTDLAQIQYKDSLDISLDPVKWAKRMIELDVPDPAEVYLRREREAK